MRPYEALESAKDQLKHKIERIQIYKDKVTKADTLEFIQAVLDDLELIDLDSMHDDCYSSDQIREYVEDEIEERDRQKERELIMTSPEEHRARFGVIEGAA